MPRDRPRRRRSLVAAMSLVQSGVQIPPEVLAAGVQSSYFGHNEFALYAPGVSMPASHRRMLRPYSMFRATLICGKSA